MLWHYYLRPSQGSPPHTRGIPQPVPQPQPQPGITPAHAGNTEGFPKIIHANGDHPRTRGEYVQTMVLGADNKGSPPHTRGIHFVEKSRPVSLGITPAHAGNTQWNIHEDRENRDHPRTRGEYFRFSLRTSDVSGSPPHTRGILVIVHGNQMQDGITPAHAGNTRCSSSRQCCPRDHPRTRGEYLFPSGNLGNTWGSPPHTRGIPFRPTVPRAYIGITPAHAGNTGRSVFYRR